MTEEGVRSEADLREDLKQLSRVSEAETDVSSRRGGGVRRFLLTVLVLAAAAGGAYAYMSTQEQSLEVRLVPVTRRDIGVPPVIMTGVGNVVPRRQITVSSKAQGKIVEMPVEENQRVFEGDLIARIEDDQVRANLQLAEAQLSSAQRELKRTRQLFEADAIPQFRVDEAVTKFEIARAQVAVAKVTVDDTVIRAPFEGTIVRKIRDVGEFVTLGVTAEGDPGTALVTLADLDQIEVELKINETDIRRLYLRMPAIAIPEARPQMRFMGEVADISPRADPRTATVDLRVAIRNPEGELLPGMTTKVRFLKTAPRGEVRVQPAVPRTAIVTYEGRPSVWVVDSSIAQPVTVVADARGRDDFSAEARPDVGAPGDGSSEDFVALLEGPPEGTYVIERPPAGLRPGEQIKVAP